MTSNPAIPFELMTKKPERPTAKRPPPAYGKYLEKIREGLGLDRAELAARTGIEYNTVLRNENGSDYRSVKGSTSIRDALIALGAKVLPVSTDDDWTEESASGRAVSKLSGAAEKLRLNLIRFREHLGIDQYAAAHLAGLPVVRYRGFEDGAEEIPLAILEELAEALGCGPGDFFAEPTAPLPNLKMREYWLGGPVTEQLTDEARAAIDKIIEPFLTERREKRRTAKRK